MIKSKLSSLKTESSRLHYMVYLTTTDGCVMSRVHIFRKFPRFEANKLQTKFVLLFLILPPPGNCVAFHGTVFVETLFRTSASGRKRMHDLRCVTWPCWRCSRKVTSMRGWIPEGRTTDLWWAIASVSSLCEIMVCFCVFFLEIFFFVFYADFFILVFVFFWVL